ncbi:MAG: hypothetical protein P1P87_12190 [Trueperaceae bacterium]|nr:hypothetical protein [Trueperaceae bacterium]
MARTGAPLAAGWLFMASELVMITAVVARLPDPELQLAAWGVAFAISTLVQSSSTVLLPTSTAWSRDGATYRRLRRYAWIVLAGLTSLHALVALTPLYGLIVDRAMGVPPEVAADARVALIVMLPWTVGTGWRRFLQGMMIRHGRSSVVIWGTMVRLATGAAVLVVGGALDVLPGAWLAAVAIIAAVLSEMTYTQLRAVPVVRRYLPPGPEPERPLTFARFFAFFSPLVVMTLLSTLVLTLVTTSLARMPSPIVSLAVWPVLFGLLMLFQSPGFAYTEVVISLLRRPGAVPVLRRFTVGLVVSTSVLLLVVALTPLAKLWFTYVAGLPAPLADLARAGLLGALAVPGLRVLLSWYQGAIMYGERTRGIMASVAAYLGVAALVLVGGAAWGGAPGVYVGVAALTLAMAAQALWLAGWARPVLSRRERANGALGATP